MAQISLFPGIEIQQLCFDSRKAVAGSVFFAIPGTQVDGHSFLAQVYEQGCKHWIVEKTPAELPASFEEIKISRDHRDKRKNDHCDVVV